MSRSLGQTSCARCGKDGVIKLTEKPRPITVEEAGVYFSEYEGMLVAHAACWVCGARYLGWVDERPRPPAHRGRYAEPVMTLEPGGYFDLSYRSTFNDEPGPDDLPPYDPNAVEALCTEALFLIDRAMKTARADPDRRVRTVQMNNLRAAHHELLGAWDCRNDQPRHGKDATERSKTMKYSGTGATFDATLMSDGQLYINEKDRGETHWWRIPHDGPSAVQVGELGLFVLRILKDKLDVLAQEGRLY